MFRKRSCLLYPRCGEAQKKNGPLSAGRPYRVTERAEAYPAASSSAVLRLETKSITARTMPT